VSEREREREREREKERERERERNIVGEMGTKMTTLTATEMIP
jgi:hypothetical protein